MSIEYIKTSWQDGDIITADKMNNIENGIKDVGDTIGELKENFSDVETAINYAPQKILLNKSIDTNNSSKAIIPSNIYAYNSWCCLCVPCVEGDVFNITGYGGGTTRLWAFSTSSGTLLTQSDAQANETDLNIVAPANAAYFAYNSRMSSPYRVYKGVIPTKAIKGEKARAINAEYGVLRGYNAEIMQGDVIHGGTGNGSLIVTSTTDAITKDIQHIDEPKVLTTDWTKYKIYVWSYNGSSWSAVGWKTGDYQLPANFSGRFVFRKVDDTTLTDAELQDIIKSTSYKTGVSQSHGDFISICHQGYTVDSGLGNNLLSGYSLAAKMGFDYGECDVKLSSDNVVMCCHDTSFVDATTGDTIVIAQHTSDELKTYNYYGSTIATLDEIMKACKENGIGLVLDHIHSANLQYVFPIVKKYGMQKRVAYLVGWAQGNSGYASNMFDAISAFYSGSDIMFMMAPSVQSEILTFLQNLNITKQRIRIAVNYTSYSVSDLQTLIASLSGEESIALYTVDTRDKCIEYLPYVTAITSNKVSSEDIFC